MFRRIEPDEEVTICYFTNQVTNNYLYILIYYWLIENLIDLILELPAFWGYSDFLYIQWSSPQLKCALNLHLIWNKKEVLIGHWIWCFFHTLVHMLLIKFILNSTFRKFSSGTNLFIYDAPPQKIDADKVP